jgi:CDP-2,3-bis-(O-geranylgeranyl)-sn-glycerol synthase
MNDISISVRLLSLLCVANTAPIIAKRVLGMRWSAPLDAGWCFIDGQPLLGSSKTVRGFVSAIACAAFAAALLGFSPGLGAKVGAFAMLGDLLSSFVKRRLRITPSGQALGIDQIPEAVLPLIMVRGFFNHPILQIAAITAAFFALDALLSRPMYWLGLRDRPY